MFYAKNVGWVIIKAPGGGDVPSYEVPFDSGECLFLL